MEKFIIVTSSIFTGLLLVVAIFVLVHMLPVAAKNDAVIAAAGQLNNIKEVDIKPVQAVSVVKEATSTKPEVKTEVAAKSSSSQIAVKRAANPVVKPAVVAVAKPAVKPAKAVQPTVKAATASTLGKYGTTMKWDAKATKLISNFQAYDYSTAIRSSYIKKVEAYARRNGYSVVTYAVVDSMRE